MKKKNYLMLAVAVAMAACSGDDASPVTTDDNQKELVKKEWFFPSSANFDSRNVKYYNGSNIVADSTFSNSGNLLSTNIHIYTPTSHSWTTMNPGGVPAGTTEYLYDSLGRLIEHRFYATVKKFTYNGNAITIKKLNLDTQQFEVTHECTTDAEGRIIKINALDLGFPVAEYLVYENGLPAELKRQQNNGDIHTSSIFTYYNVATPVQQSLSTNFVNSEILIAGTFTYVPQQFFPNIKLVQVQQPLQTSFEAQAVFDANGFILSQKALSDQGETFGETHYTYNQQ